jgi:hypothetical protein
MALDTSTALERATSEPGMGHSFDASCGLAQAGKGIPDCL